MKLRPKSRSANSALCARQNQPQVFYRRLAAFRMRNVVVMKLEKPALGATPAIRAHERALSSVALVHLANHRARDVARAQFAPAHAPFDRALSLGRPCLSEALFHGL